MNITVTGASGSSAERKLRNTRIPSLRPKRFWRASATCDHASSSPPPLPKMPPTSDAVAIALVVPNQGGDPAAAQRLWERYFHRLVGLARAKLQGHPRRAADEESDELAPNHSMTSSARALSVRGRLMPNAFAVLKLMINCTLLACWTGRSAGFSPLRMRPV